jgi:hypothetical protein
MIIIPLGEECYTSMSMDERFSENLIRKCSLPYDYVGNTFIKSIHNNLVDILVNKKNEAYCYINIEDLSTCYNQHTNLYYIANKTYGFIYFHDITSTTGNFNSGELELFLKKYNRRYQRLIDFLNSTEPITFVSTCHFENIYAQKYSDKTLIIDIYNFLKKFKTNISFYAINYTELESTKDNLNFVSLPVYYNIPKEESKILFEKELCYFMTILNKRI